MLDMPDYAQGEVYGSGDVRGVSYGSDKGLFVEFRTEPVHMEFKSKAEGRAVYEDRIFVKIYVPGDKTKVIDRYANLEQGGDVPPDNLRWPAQWAAFQAGKKAEMTGTPLAVWPQITKQQVQEFNAFNVYTVEQLAAVSDAALDGLGHGGRSLRDGAIAWLDRADGDSAIAKLEAKHSEEIQAMRDQMARLEEMLTAPQEEKRSPGRPRKEMASASE